MNAHLFDALGELRWWLADFRRDRNDQIRRAEAFWTMLDEYGKPRQTEILGSLASELARGFVNGEFDFSFGHEIAQLIGDDWFRASPEVREQVPHMPAICDAFDASPGPLQFGKAAIGCQTRDRLRGILRSIDNA